MEELAAAKEARHGWATWARDAFADGVGRAHRFTRAAVSWKPEATLMLDGQVTADPYHLLQAEGKSLLEKWHALQDAPEGFFSSCGGRCLLSRSSS